MHHRTTVAAAATLLAGLPGLAQAIDISIANAASTYTQNFDTLPITGNNNTWVNGSTLTGWHLFRLESGINVATTSITASNGTAVAPLPSLPPGFKSAGTTGSTERALGAQGFRGPAPSSPFSGFIATSFVNATAAALDSFTLRYDGEQWRKGGEAGSVDTLPVSYGFGSSFATVSSWTAAGAGFTFTSPVGTAGGAALDGNAAANRVADLGGTVAVAWAPGSTLWVRWAEIDNTPLGTADHFMAIDNVRLSVTAVSAVPEPQTYALMLAGLAGVGFIARRRRAG